MGTTRHVARRPARAKLNGLQEMELWLGVCRIGPTFTSDRARRAAWLRHYDRLMQRWAHGGHRPFGWWRYSAPLGLRRRFPGQYERSTLCAGVLAEQERLELEKFWRAEFEKVLAPDFSLCVGGKVLTGFAAGVEHLIFVDLPPALCDRWEREREWRGSRKRVSPPPKSAEAISSAGETAG